MAAQDKADRNIDRDKAEGERWESDPETVRNVDRDENPERLYEDNTADGASGITNRPLSQEIGSQEALPERGTSRDRTRNPDSTRPEGDYTEDER